MLHSTREPNSRSSSQEIEIHCRVHKSPPPVPVLSQMNPVHTFPLSYTKIHSNITFPFTFKK
jgi:hypothetical protein